MPKKRYLAVNELNIALTTPYEPNPTAIWLKGGTGGRNLFLQTKSLATHPAFSTFKLWSSQENFI